jgi:hypothetical protein
MSQSPEEAAATHAKEKLAESAEHRASAASVAAKLPFVTRCRLAEDDAVPEAGLLSKKVHFIRHGEG